MSIASTRLRYAQFFTVGLLSISLWVASQSMTGEISQFNRNFWGSKFLVTSAVELKLALGDRVFPQALVAKEGWLEYTSGQNLDGYQNAIRTRPDEFEELQRKLRRFHRELQKRGISLVVVVSPNKATIYPDKLPDQLKKLTPKSKLDAFTDHIQQHGPPGVLVDLRPALLDGRKEQDVYYKTDTHWNDYGAFIAYKAIMQQAAATYPQLTPKNIDDFQITVTQPRLRDIPRTIGATYPLESSTNFRSKQDNIKWLTYNNDSIIPLSASVSPQKDLPRLVMYMDSFGEKMTKFIAPHFSEAVFIKVDSDYPSLLTFEALEVFKPNVVIIEIVERSFNVEILDSFLEHFLGK